MPLTLMRLEERVVLDAAGAGDADPAATGTDCAATPADSDSKRVSFPASLSARPIRRRCRET